jgi:hypothetical protein
LIPSGIAHPTQDPFLERVSLESAVEDVHISTESHPPNRLEMTALLDEPSGPGQLILYYRISTPQGRVLIQPGAISSYVLLRSGLIACSKSSCDKRFGPNTYLVHSGWSFDLSMLDELPDYSPTLGRSVFIWKHTSSDLARLLALELQRQSSYGSRARAHVLLRQDECLPCSTRSAFQMRPAPDAPSMTYQDLFHIL